MEVHQLQILRELGALGSVSAVAKVLNVSPSAVSQHLTALQRSFSTPLTAKQGRTLALTDAGQVLADAGAEVIDAMAAARTAVETFEQSAGGTVAVSGFHSAGQSLFGLLLQELARLPTAPDVRLTDEDVPRQDFPGLTARYDLVIAHRLDHSPPGRRPACAPSPWSGNRWTSPCRSTIRWPAARNCPPTRWPASAGSPPAAATPPTTCSTRWPRCPDGSSPWSTGSTTTARSTRSSRPATRSGWCPGTPPPLAPPGSIVLRPLTGIGARRTIDLLTRPENLRRRSVRVVAQALNRVVAGIIRERQ